jgi:CheY-like chemotaxis protein
VDKGGLDNLDEIPPGRYVVLSISDTGTGMNQETMARIFEPYYTTKEQGRGTGLGLSVVHGIVKGHHGRIGVYSELGQGTTFNVYLPIIIAETVEKPVQKLPAPANGERVMIVDDEEAIRSLHCQFLVDNGYKVKGFSDGREAWEAMTANPASWDILLTDRTMPEMTGEQLINKVRKIRPDMPIVLCSGYNSKIDESSARLEDVTFLPKPVDRLGLLNCLAGLREG